jgi:hypothetical protein
MRSSPDVVAVEEPDDVRPIGTEGRGGAPEGVHGGAQFLEDRPFGFSGVRD